MKLHATQNQIDSLKLNKSKKALETLTKLNVLTNFNNENLYHGRNDDINSTWDVESISDSHTINFKQPGRNDLYVSDLATASEFAINRTKTNNQGVASTHLIKSTDKDASVLNDLNTIFKFNNNEDRARFINAINDLDFPKISSIDYHPNLLEILEYNTIIKYILKHSKSETSLIDNNTKQKALILMKNSTDPELRKIDFNYLNETKLNKYINTFNSALLLRKAPDKVLDKYFSYNLALDYFYLDYNDHSYSLDVDYITKFLKDNHIIGYKGNIDSVSVNHNINLFYLFDLDKVHNNEILEKQDLEYQELYSRLNNSLNDLIDENNFKFIKDASPIELVDFIRQDKLCDALYSMKTTNFEGFHVYEHTCAALDIFDKYYKDKYPDNLQVLMKIAILGHDVGKGFTNTIDNDKQVTYIANKLNKDKRDFMFTLYNGGQDYSNNYFYDYFLNTLNVNDKYNELVKFIMSDSQKYTSDYFVKYKFDNNKEVIINKYLASLAKQTHLNTFNDFIKDNDIKTLIELAVDLQQSDSASYTTYSKIPMTKHHLYINGVNQHFTNSFTKDKHNNIYLKDNFIYTNRLEKYANKPKEEKINKTIKR